MTIEQKSQYSTTATTWEKINTHLESSERFLVLKVLFSKETIVQKNEKIKLIVNPN